MRNPDMPKIPFDSKSAFDKPAACDYVIKGKGTLFQVPDSTDVTLGSRKKESVIYYTDQIIAGHYELPRPLVVMTEKEIDKTFPDNAAYITDRSKFKDLWKLANKSFEQKTKGK